MIAFDDCTILNSCSIVIRKSHQIIFSKKELKSKHKDKIEYLFTQLNKKGEVKYRFVPSNIGNASLRIVNELIENTGVNHVMLDQLANTFKNEAVEQLVKYNAKVEKDFKTIQKSENIEEIKDFFKKNERNLTKQKNIPENDDLSIMQAYADYPSKTEKILISHDEHFWGYKDLIKQEYNLRIIEEWHCHKLIE